jgi:mRNA-degrading endonuclease RelE of RelBE toxin-antitoxin system
MSYASEFTPVFVKLLTKLDKQILERVLRAVEDILIDPRQGSRLVYSEQNQADEFSQNKMYG